MTPPPLADKHFGWPRLHSVSRCNFPAPDLVPPSHVPFGTKLLFREFAPPRSTREWPLAFVYDSPVGHNLVVHGTVHEMEVIPEVSEDSESARIDVTSNTESCFLAKSSTYESDIYAVTSKALRSHLDEDGVWKMGKFQRVSAGFPTHEAARVYLDVYLSVGRESSVQAPSNLRPPKDGERCGTILYFVIAYQPAWLA